MKKNVHRARLILCQMGGSDKGGFSTKIFGDFGPGGAAKSPPPYRPRENPVLRGGPFRPIFDPFWGSFWGVQTQKSMTKLQFGDFLNPKTVWICDI